MYLLKGPVLFSHFFILSEWAKFFRSHKNISIIFLSYFTSVKSIIFVCEYWIYGYLWEKDEGHWTKKSGDVFFSESKLKSEF